MRMWISCLAWMNLLVKVCWVESRQEALLHRFPSMATFKVRVQHLEKIAAFIGVDSDHFEGGLLLSLPALRFALY